MNRIVPPLALVALLLAGCSDAPNADSDAAGTTLEVTGTDALTFEPSELAAGAGTITVELTAGTGVNHTLAIEGVEGGRPVVETEAGQTSSGSVDLTAGSYTVYCSVPGHREAGMQATLTVS